MNASKTLDQDLTSKEKVFEPYWNASCAEMSKKLLSLTKTGFVGSDLNCLNKLHASTIQNSWFSIKLNCHLKTNLSKTYLPLFTFSRTVFTDSENTVNRSKKIRIYLKPKSKVLAKKYLGLTRYWFNQAIEYLKQDGTKASLKEVRKIQYSKVHPEWALDCPQRIREHAIDDACEAIKNAKKKFMETGEFQEVKFRAKKNIVQRFGFDAQSLNENFVFSQKKFKTMFESSEEFSAQMEGTRIVYEDHRWFLIVPQKRKIKIPENQRYGIVSLDPGVRNFVSFYSEVATGNIGKGDFNHIYYLCLQLDEIISNISKAKCEQKKRLILAKKRLIWRITDLIDDLHKKTAHFLVTRFDTIFLPTFKTSEMVAKLNSKTARNMLNFAHYRFKQFLKIKAEEYSCEVINVSEAYTSRTCSYCGTLHAKNSKKRMVCDCGANVDRDLNGARGIMLKNISLTKPLALWAHTGLINHNC